MLIIQKDLNIMKEKDKLINISNISAIEPTGEDQDDT
jgi:hypothetical protein